MSRITGLEMFELDLPFRRPFRHAAAERVRSDSLFLSCVTDDGHRGYGETLPRRYVTGEDRGEAFDLLAERVMPRLLDLEFGSFREVLEFLTRCDGKAPAEWVDPAVPQTAAWCLVDLALLDTFGRAFGVNLREELAGGGAPGLAGAGPAGGGNGAWPEDLRYGVGLSDDSRRRMIATLLKTRLYGVRDVKVKVDAGSRDGVGLARRLLGRKARLRVDSNMAWTRGEARARMDALSRHGVVSFEQPLPADDVDGMAELVAVTDHGVMADESLHDAESLERLIARRACTAVNVRIAKCGGLVASVARCRRALEAGLTVQVGCQVGETSHLSAAQMVLIGVIGDGVRYLEGAYGERLLQKDPVRPRLEFRRGGRPPRAPAGGGLGTETDKRIIHEFAGRRVALGSGIPPTEGDVS